MNTQFNGGRAWRSSNPSRQLDGLSQPLTRNLQDMSQSQLVELYDKTSTMLNNPTLNLPDGGAKLKAKLEQIKSLLETNNNTENKDVTNGITGRVSEMSLNEKPDIRKETLLRSNEVNAQPSKLLRSSHDGVDQQQTRGARMMSLEESVKLQESQQKDIKLANMRKRMEALRPTESLADDLALTMSSLRLDPETRVPRPDDDGPSDTEGQDKDSDDEEEDSEEESDMEDIIDDNYERYDDEGYEEEEQEFEDGQLHNNNNRRI